MSDRTPTDKSSQELPVVRTYFYYVRDALQHPIMTVCLKFDTETNTPYRGVAICSMMDNATKKIGRAIAEYRASFPAKNDCEEGYPVKRWDILPEEAANFLDQNGINWKSQANPILTDYEKKILQPVLGA